MTLRADSVHVRRVGRTEARTTYRYDNTASPRSRVVADPSQLYSSLKTSDSIDQRIGFGKCRCVIAETRKLTIVIDSELDDELTSLAIATGRDKLVLAREALAEWLEDQEDARDAETIIAQGNPTIPLEEVKRSLGLER